MKEKLEYDNKILHFYNLKIPFKDVFISNEEFGKLYNQKNFIKRGGAVQIYKTNEDKIAIKKL